MIGERILVNLSSNLAQHAIERILTYKYAFFADDENATGKLSGTHDELYEQDGDYREIFNASARSLNLDRISKTLEIETYH